MIAVKISVIIITLNEAANLASTILATKQAAQSRSGHLIPLEIIVSDGNSEDGTVSIAQKFADKVIVGPRGRATQLNAGARIATGEILLFLHADTLLPPGGLLRVWHALHTPEIIGGGFMKDWIWRPISRQSRLVNAVRYLWEGFGNWVVLLLKKFPGDNAIFVRRKTFDALGGFANLWICEDFEFSRCLVQLCKQKPLSLLTGMITPPRVICIPASVKTSARRFEDKGFIQTLKTWTFIYLFWLLGMPQDRLKRLFRHYSTSPNLSSRSLPPHSNLAYRL